MSPAALGFAIVAFAAATAHAQAIPAGYERFQVMDLTVTMRDDAFSTITTDPADPRTIYVGTFQGRFYKTTDAGQTWTESTVIPEQGLLWQAPGSSIFFGAIRSAGSSSGSVPLLGERPSPLDFDNVPAQLGRAPFPDTLSPLEEESDISAGSSGEVFGIGLSDRSPRLSILTGSRGRPVPTINRQKFLNDRTLRGTLIWDIMVDQTDRRRLYAATVNGLYKSYDGGESWSRTFAGMTAGERVAYRIAASETNPRLMILGTGSGAYTSTDGGDSWTKISTIGGAIYDIAFDDKDPNYVYVVGAGAVMRSTDGGKSFIQTYFSTFPAEADVRSIVIDPFDPETGYISTMRGAFVTHKLRSGWMQDWTPLEGVQSILNVTSFDACSKHRGHLYALTRLELPQINYGATPPESAMIESWDGGKTWRRLFTGQSDGISMSFTTDENDPDQLWIGWTTALHHLERGEAANRAPTTNFVLAADQRGPSLSEIVLATLRHNGLELEDYSKKLQNSQNWLVPRAFTVSGTVRQYSVGGVQDDQQFAAGRYFQIGSAREWEVMAWATWDLPEAVYSSNSPPMIRLRVQQLNDELRRRLVETVRRSYGEVLRIRARLAEPNLDLKTRITYWLRIEQLEAVVDLTSGGYLTRWHKQHRRLE